MSTRACRTCGEYILLFQRYDKRGWVPLNPDPVPEHLKDANTCAALSGVWVWPILELVPEIQMSREVSLAEANRIARDEFVWHTRHRCEAAA